MLIHKPMLRVNDQQRENNLFDEVSNFMSIIQRSFSIMETIAGKIQKKADHSHLNQKLKQILNQLQFLQQKLTDLQQKKCLESITFDNLFFKLIKTIAFYKSKYKQYLLSISTNNLINLITDIENAVLRSQQSKLFSQIINAVKNSIIQFCKNCYRPEQFSYYQQENVQTQVYQRLSDKIRTIQNDKIPIQKIYAINLRHPEDNRMSNQPNFDQKIQKITIICQNITDIQAQFDFLEGIQLDFCYFKTSLCLAKTNLYQFQKNYIAKNLSISKLITQYCNDFLFMLKRKQQKQAKKDRKSKTKDANYLNDPDNMERLSLEDNKMHKNRLQTCSLKPFKYNYCSLNRDTTNKQLISHKYSNLMTPDESKISHKRKDIFLVFKKKREDSKPLQKNNSSGSGIIKKKTILQKASINQSYYNGLDYNLSNQIDYLHSKFKLRFNLKLNSRSKIAPQTSHKNIETQFKDQTAKIIDATSQAKVIGYINSANKLNNKFSQNEYKYRKHTKSNLILGAVNRNGAISLNNPTKPISEQPRLLLQFHD